MFKMKVKCGIDFCISEMISYSEKDVSHFANILQNAFCKYLVNRSCWALFGKNKMIVAGRIFAKIIRCIGIIEVTQRKS